MSDLFWLIHVNLTQLLSSAQTKPNTSTVDCLHSVYSPSGDFWNQQSNMGVDLSSDHAISQSLRPILTLWQDYVSYVSRCSGCEGVPPNEADFYRCFTSETGCCFSFTALNENQLQTSVGAVRMCVCVCVCVAHPVFVGKNLTPIPYQQTAWHFFFFSTPSSSLCFVYSPWSSPTPPFLLTLPQTRSDLAAVCVPASYCCVYHRRICLRSLQRAFVLFGEAKGNSDV